MPAETEPETKDAGGGFPALADTSVNPLALTGMNQPLWLQNSTYPAALDRLLIAAALETGVQGLNELVVSQRAAGANYSVDVAAGRVVVPVTDAPNLGSALCTSTAVNNLTVAGAPGAGLSRIDLVIARVYDASLIGGSINGWQLEIVTGTPAASPAIPATPTSAIVLAQLAVAAGQASIQAANITDRRAIPGVWRPFTPTWWAETVLPTLGNGTMVGRYMVRGKTCSFWVRITFGSTTTGGQGAFRIYFPPGNVAANTFAIQGSCYTLVPGYPYIGIPTIVDPQYLALMFPLSPTALNVGFWQNNAGAAGTGVPAAAGANTIQPGGSMWVAATYETT